MRMLYLGKRHNMDIDSVGERHGRAYHLPWELSRLGHDVCGLYMDYRSRDGRWLRCDDQFDISVCSVRGRWLPHFVNYYRELRRVIRESRPEVVIAGSDALNVVIGRNVASRLQVPFVADVKDDYAAFGLTRNVPFLERAYYQSLGAADLVTCVSGGLEATLRSKGVSRTMVLENAVPSAFAPTMTRARARQELGLPQGFFLFGLAGALRSSRNIGTVVEGARRFLLDHERAALVLAGPRDQDFSVPADVVDQVYDFGKLESASVPVLMRALDLGLIPNREGDFGDHCYPQKYNEMRACGLPVAAARVGAFKADAADGVVFRWEAEESGDLAANLSKFVPRLQRGDFSALSSEASTWADRARSLDSALRGMWLAE